MRVRYAQQATPGGAACEDYLVAGPGWVLVLDGATARPGVRTGCLHTVAWLVRRLAGELARDLAAEDGGPLPDLLAAAITAVRGAHSGTCDLANPDSPSSTVALLRRHADRLDWLVLADSPIVLDTRDGVLPVLDERVAALPVRTAAAVRAARNSPGGFWVASTDPRAAHEARTGSLPAAAVRRAGLYTDGGARLVEYFGVLDWPGLLDLTEAEGPAAVIARTRAAELAGAGGGAPGKRHDDATVVLTCGFTD